jgi:hypothetical protein
MKGEIKHRKTAASLDYFDTATGKQKCVGPCQQWLELKSFPVDEMKILERGRKCNRCRVGRAGCKRVAKSVKGAQKALVKFPREALEQIDLLVHNGKVFNRSEFIRQAVQEKLDKLQLKHALKNGSDTDLP